MNKFNPQNVHIFWDSRVTWRGQQFVEYKAHRDSTDVKDIITHQVLLCRELFDNLGVYQYFVNLQEADDLIYAFCHANQGKKNVIVSSDADLKQTMHKFDKITVYNPLTKQIVKKDKLNPIYAKALIGDKSDNIDGYKGIGKVTAAKLLKEGLADFLASDKAKNASGEVVGKDLFIRNINLIDLSRSPYLDSNIKYVKSIKKSEFDYNKLIDILKSHKVETMGYLQDYLLSFKNQK